jgi:hypothetical protein
MRRDIRKAYSISVGKPERKRPLGVRRLRWKGKIKMYLQQGVRLWARFVMLRMLSSGRFL